MLALTPEPENCSVTLPGGTPFSVNWPDPSTVLVMSVPLIVTRSDVVARGANEFDWVLTGRLLMPFTRPVITAVEPFAEGPVGESDADPPHAILDATATLNAKTIHRGLITVMSSFLLPRTPAG